MTVWIACLGSLALAGLIALIFGFMATSADPTALVTTGLDVWSDALIAAAALAGAIIVTALALRAWHSVRFRVVGALLTVVQVCGVAWTSVWFYREYF